tara:strand:- start:850 stop:1545 length:696 start_codon:yes stop_codon:yes gene_type:complete
MIRQHTWLSEVICKNINDLYNCGEFLDGKTTGTTNREVKRNRELAGDVVDTAAKLFMDAFREDPWMTSFHMRHCTAPLFNEYDAEIDDNGEYKLHCDSSIMNGLRSDLVILTAINDESEYEGGNLTIKVGNIDLVLRLKTGQSVVFDPNLWHTVSPVTKGKRRMCVMWAEALIQDTWAREMFYDYIDIAARCLNSIDEDKWFEQGNETDPATYLGALRQKILRQYSNPLNN